MMSDKDQETTAKPSRWRQALKTIFFAVLYMVPLLWLWNKTDYPRSFGIHITAHGKAGLLENWWYSYLLLKRHHLWDIAAFAYMWAAVAAIVGWLGWAIISERKASRAQDAEAQ